MEEIKYIRPRVASTEIDIALDLFDRDEAMKRITSYITGLLDDAESQFNRAVANARTGEKQCNLPVVNGSFLPKCNRVEVIDQSGRAYVNWKPTNKVEVMMQDDERTLKVFIS